MDHKEAHHLRLYVLAALFFIVAAVYIGVLYDTQVNNYDYYYASSVRSIARSETVEAARGNITDRNGKVLVSSRSSYNLTFWRRTKMPTSPSCGCCSCVRAGGSTGWILCPSPAPPPSPTPSTPWTARPGAAFSPI